MSEPLNLDVFLAHWRGSLVPAWETYYLPIERLLDSSPKDLSSIDWRAVFTAGDATEAARGVSAGRWLGEPSVNRVGDDDGTSSRAGATDESFADQLRLGLVGVNGFFATKHDELVKLFAELRVLGRGRSLHAKPTRGRQVLRESYCDLFSTISALKNFATVNYNAVFVLVGAPIGELSFSNSPAAAFFHASTVLAELGLDVTRAYAELFAGGDMGAARRELSERQGRRPRSWTNHLFLGFYLGWSLPLCVLAFAMLFGESAPGYNAEETIYPVLPVFRATGVMVLVFLLWGGAVFVMESFSINFGFILQLHPETQLDHYRLFKSGALLASFWLSAFVLYMAQVRRNLPIFARFSASVYPFVLVCAFLALLVLPVSRVLHGPSRLWLMQRIFHVICSPFTPVAFADNLIGDYLTSLVKVLYDVEYVSCYYLSGDWRTSDFTYCLATNQKFALPILTALPYFFRLMQCLRRYYDTGQRWPHLGNALKYLIAMMAVTAGAAHSSWSSYGSAWTIGRICWLVLLIVATVYAYIWDISMDWSLVWFDFGTRRLQFRKVFLYGPPWMYVFPAVLNLAGRFVWSMTLVTQPVQGLINHQLAVLMYTVIEVVRRSGWALLRIEAEASLNQSRFRDVQAVPSRSGDFAHVVESAMMYASIRALAGQENEPEVIESNETLRARGARLGVPDAHRALRSANTAKAPRVEATERTPLLASDSPPLSDVARTPAGNVARLARVARTDEFARLADRHVAPAGPSTRAAAPVPDLLPAALVGSGDRELSRVEFLAPGFVAPPHVAGVDGFDHTPSQAVDRLV